MLRKSVSMDSAMPDQCLGRRKGWKSGIE